MKRILSLILSLSLLCGAALADTEITDKSESKSASTTITYTIEQNEEYIVTIPSALALEQTGDDLPAGTMDISISAENFNVPYRHVSVYLDGADFKLTHENGEDYMPYTIALDEENEIKLNDIVASWCTGEEACTVTLNVQVTSLDEAKVSGEYSDTLTFYVNVGTTYVPV